jgi:hypothetical protein
MPSKQKSKTEPEKPKPAADVEAKVLAFAELFGGKVERG